jgi:hypothetical protein
MADSVKICLQKSGYSNSYRNGKEAIKNEYRDKIRVNNPRNLRGSLDIDKTCQTDEPTAHRWDYLVVIWKTNNENLALIEVHEAGTPRAINDMIKKKEWLIQWLPRAGLTGFKKKLIWVATGRSIITSQSRYGKRLAVSGIEMPKRVTPLLDTEVEYI